MLILLIIWILCILGFIALYGVVGFGLFTALTSGNMYILVVVLIAGFFLIAMTVVCGSNPLVDMTKELKDLSDDE